MSITHSAFLTQIRNYTEVDSNVLTQTLIDQMIANAEQRIWLDVPIDAYRKVSEAAGMTDLGY